MLEPREPVTFALRLEPEFATLVSLGEEESLIAGLRRRRILMDSPRVLARDDREQSGGREPAGASAGVKPRARAGRHLATLAASWHDRQP